ncbi:spermatogenesis-associated protein 5-like isoform X2 [Acanthaster planci]|uniref:non-chaperonin molecular chaperone ATPase n=1 Tax=Acanthaster planci TaxID=133434 RepID=A0A8B7XZ00_ACAPL|nr:spermatogenesis-associated protein 5-like isoform X2 [Acanthaster planci]
MSAKKKPGRSEWLSCQVCDILVSSRDWPKHKTQCPGSRGATEQWGAPTSTVFFPDRSGAQDGSDTNGRHGRGRRTDTTFHHGFVRSGVLYSEVCLQAEKGNEKLPSSSHQLMVHLNPDTMRLCNLCIGRPALLTSLRSKVKLIATAWPVANFPAASVGINGNLQKVNGVVGNDLVCVKAVEGPMLLAADIKLFSVHQGKFLQSLDFKKYFLRSVEGRCILPGSILSISYYGKPVLSQVIEITHKDGTMINIDQSPYRTQPRLSSQSESMISDVNFAEGNLNLDASLNAENSFLGRSNLETGNSSRNSINKNAGSLNSISEMQSLLSDSMDSGSEALHHFISNFVESSNSPNISTSTPKKINSTAGNMQGLSESFQELEIGVLHVPEDGPSGKSSSDRTSTQDCQQLVFSSIGTSTNLVFVTRLDKDKSLSDDEAKHDLVTYDKIGGLSRQLKTIRETLELPLKNPKFFKSLGVAPPRGVLMYGPPGVGKTMIARAVANEVGAHVTIINGPEVMSRYYGESEARLRSIFREAAKSAPSLIFIDELDALCPHRERVQSDLEKRIVATLLTLMDGVDALASRGHLMVLGATNRPDAVDPALRRPGRFDREIEIGVPNAGDRADILSKCLQHVPHTLTKADITVVADTAHGYVGADLAAVCKEAAIHSFERLKGTLSDSELKDTVSVSSQDVLLALKTVKPSAMREVEIRVPRVHWSDIGGQVAIKQKLKQAVEWPIKHPEAFQRLGITPPRGILMYGPPGCSKTLIAKALATESGLNFISVKGPELFNKWVGESERAVREVFRKARTAAPAIIFFDEIDALAVERGSSSGGSNVADRVLGQLLTEIDGVEKLQDVTIVAATNRPDMIDKALLRPGRLDRILHITLPDSQTRRDIFQIQFRIMPIASDVDVESLVGETEKYSGAEVVALCREAGLAAMQEDINIDSVCARHFMQALQTVQPRTPDKLIRFYEDYIETSGLHSI